MILLTTPEKQQMRKETCESCEFYNTENDLNLCDFLPGYSKLNFTRRTRRFKCPLNKF